MTKQRASELLAMIKVKEQSELTVNSWWGSFVKDYKEALQIAIKSLETIQRIDDVLNVEGMTEIDVLDEIMEAVSEFRYDCGVEE